MSLTRNRLTNTSFHWLFFLTSWQLVRNVYMQSISKQLFIRCNCQSQEKDFLITFLNSSCRTWTCGNQIFHYAGYWKSCLFIKLSSKQWVFKNRYMSKWEMMVRLLLFFFKYKFIFRFLGCSWFKSRRWTEQRFSWFKFIGSGDKWFISCIKNCSFNCNSLLKNCKVFSHQIHSTIQII